MTIPTIYLEVDSTYRDRNQYPQPADFITGVGQSGTKSISQAYDPVSDSAPKLAWNSSFTQFTADVSVSLSTTPIESIVSGRTILVVRSDVSEGFRTEPDYYAGALLNLTVSASPTIVRRILKSEIVDDGVNGVSSSLLRLTLDSSIPDLTYSGGSIPLPSLDTTAYTTASIFLPSSLPIDNYYINTYITNSITGETKRITAYNGTTHLATLDSNTATNWRDGNLDFTISSALPINSGSIPIADAINTLGGISANLSVVQLASTASSDASVYLDSYLRLDHPTPAVSALAGSTNPPYGEQVKIINYSTLDGLFTAIGTNTFTLNAGVQQDNYYVNCMITNSTTNETRTITTYNGSTRSGTVSQNWGGGSAINDVFFIRSVFLLNQLSIAPTGFGGATYSPATYRIEKITRDNYCPLSYNGSRVSTNQSVCYEIELINLILPNQTLASGAGGRAVYYPYLYVVFENVSAGTTRSSGLIMSNNPNSQKAMFRAIVDDTSTFLSSPFIKIDSDGMVQTVKFKPNDTFRFAVYHQNGELFKSAMSDTSSPDYPNPLVQISAVFSLKRLD